MLFPDDPDGRGCDTLATAVSTIDNFSDLHLVASPAALARLEQQYPNLIILVADRPENNAVAGRQIVTPK